MAYVYRIHERGDVFSGMYSNISTSITIDEYSTERHPTPVNDAMLEEVWEHLSYENRTDYLFGFCTLSQLKSWIFKKEWRNRLYDVGFVISKIKSDHIHKGDTQAIFLDTDFEIVSTIELNQL